MMRSNSKIISNALENTDGNDDLIMLQKCQEKNHIWDHCTVYQNLSKPISVIKANIWLQYNYVPSYRLSNEWSQGLTFEDFSEKWSFI